MTQPNRKNNLKAANKSHPSKPVVVAINKTALLVIAGFVLGFVAGGSWFHQKDASSQPSKSVALQSYKPGDTVNSLHMDLRLTDVKFDTKGGHAFKPAKNNQFVIVNLYIKNKTDQAMPVFPINQTELKDDQGHVYRMTVAEVADPFQAGHLKPGDQIQGQLAFEVPQSLQHPTFFFDSGWTDSFISVRL